MNSDYTRALWIFLSIISALAGSACTHNAKGNLPKPPPPFDSKGSITLAAGHVANFFNDANKNNLADLSRGFYDPSVHFVDPYVDLSSRDELIRYYQHGYENVNEIRFVIHRETFIANEAYVVWTMHLKHESINDGNEIAVDGMSHIVFENGLAIYHRDYFDAGAALYEHIPILGGLVGYVKGKAAAQ